MYKKVTANRNTYLKMKANLSRILEGKERLTEAGRRTFEEIVSVASAKRTEAEKPGQRDFCIFELNPNI